MSLAPNARFPDAHSRSAALYARAREVMPSGNSRLTVFFRPYPTYIRSGQGARIIDEDGVERLDFINNYSALLHGHRHPRIMEAVADQMGRLTAVGAPTESEIALAELLVDRIPSLEQVRFANSGTEAVMLAIKAARAATGRPKIAKVEGTYHGGYDVAETSQQPLPDEWGPADRPASVALSAGTPRGVLDDVVVLPWNDVETSRRLLEAAGDRLAGVLVDVLPSRLALTPITPEYLAMLRETTTRLGALLILDEVYSLRLGYRGAQGELGVTPDLTTMAKIVGGGFPVGAIGGRREVMSVFSFDTGRPKVPHGGTYNANPVTMAAGRVAMEMFTQEAAADLAALGERMRAGLAECLKLAGREGLVKGQASLALLSLSDRPFNDHRELSYVAKFAEAQAAVHRELMNRGVFTSPALMFTLSTVMTPADIDFTLEQVLQALRTL
ncbi:MAG: aspartate aminotransferase family protein [Proteobacteria bacterium]|nr:aspartate aminotransferase family protein [Pseudomonadota bacterium]